MNHSEKVHDVTCYGEPWLVRLSHKLIKREITLIKEGKGSKTKLNVNNIMNVEWNIDITIHNSQKDDVHSVKTTYTFHESNTS